MNFGSHCTGTLIASNINNKNERDKSITIKKSVCKKSKKKPGQTFVDSNSHFSEQKEILKKKKNDSTKVLFNHLDQNLLHKF